MFKVLDPLLNVVRFRKCTRTHKLSARNLPTRTPSFESLERRSLFAILSLPIADVVPINSLPWHNPVDKYDVDGNGSILSLDAVIVINWLNEYRTGDLPTAGSFFGSPPPYVDVSGDNRLTPEDAIIEINKLNFERRGASVEDNGSYTKRTEIATNRVFESNWTDPQPPNKVDSSGDGPVETLSFEIDDGVQDDRGNAGDRFLLPMNVAAKVQNPFLSGPEVDQFFDGETATGPAAVSWLLTDSLQATRDLATYNSLEDGRIGLWRRD